MNYFLLKPISLKGMLKSLHKHILNVSVACRYERESYQIYVNMPRTEKDTESVSKVGWGNRGMWGSCGVRQMTRANSQIA